MVGPDTEVKEGESKQEPGEKPEGEKPAVNPDVVKLQRQYEGQNNQLRKDLGDSRKEVSALTLKVENLTSDIESARLYGNDEDAAKAHRELSRAQNELREGQNELVRANRVLEAAEAEASKKLIAIKYGVEEEALTGDTPDAMELSASKIAQARAEDELEKLRKGEKRPRNNAHDDGEGRTAHKSVANMTPEEFEAYKGVLRKQAEARRA